MAEQNENGKAKKEKIRYENEEFGKRGFFKKEPNKEINFIFIFWFVLLGCCRFNSFATFLDLQTNNNK